MKVASPAIPKNCQPLPVSIPPSLRRALLLTLAATCLGLGQAAAQGTGADAPYEASAPLSWELKGARWFDGRQIQRGNLYIEGGVFVARKPAKVNRKMDLRGQVLVPPLAEAHNHNLQTAWGWQQFAQRYLDEGVFYAAMLCGDPPSVAEVRPLADQPATPDVNFVTACVTSSDGYPLATLLKDANPDTARQQQQLVLLDTPEQLEAQWPAIRERAAGGMIRAVLAHHERPELRGRPDMFGRLGLSPETLTALTRRAHADRLTVAAHVESAADFDAALAAGVDWIVHLPGYANPLGDPPERFLISQESAEQAARQGTVVVTTVAATELFQPAPEILAALRTVQRQNLARLQMAHAKLLIGSDVFMGTALAEVKALDQLGALPRPELLRLATRDTPRALFPQRRLGCFEPGCEASFLLLLGDPLEDLSHLDQPLLRVKQGRLLTQLAQVAAASSLASASTADPPKKAAGGKKAGKAGSKKQAAKPATSKPAAKANRPASAKAR